MANVSEFLQQLLNARYGKDVRQSIHDSIRAINKQLEESDASALASAQAAQTAATEAKKAVDNIGTTVDNYIKNQSNVVTDDNFGEKANAYLDKNLVEYVNVKSFGAKGDGVTDDTEALNTALIQCATDKKTLYIPSGTYITSSRIDFTSCYVIGDKAILKATSNPDACTNMFYTSGIEDYYIKGITFESTVMTSLFAILNCKNGTFEDCVFHTNVTGKIDHIIDFYSNNKNISMRHCTIKAMNGGEDGGIWIRNNSSTENTDNIRFESCDLYTNNYTEQVAIWGWNGTTKNVTFDKCRFEVVEGGKPYVWISVGNESGICENTIFSNCTFINNNVDTYILNSYNSHAFNTIFNNCNFEIGGNASGMTDDTKFKGVGQTTFANCRFIATSSLGTNRIFTKCKFDGGVIDFSSIEESFVVFNECIVKAMSISHNHGTTSIGSDFYDNIITLGDNIKYFMNDYGAVATQRNIVNNLFNISTYPEHFLLANYVADKMFLIKGNYNLGRVYLNNNNSIVTENTIVHTAEMKCNLINNYINGAFVASGVVTTTE